MAVKKINHKKRILSTKPTSISRVEFPNIIEFTYDSKSDKKPLVFVLKIKNQILNGINMNYLKDAEINKLFLEDNEKNLKNWSVYKESYRTYSTKKIKSLQLVSFAESDSKKPKKPTKPEQPKKPEGGR
mgnify:CR=1 FL=1